MEYKSYEAQPGFPFGTLSVRDMTPEMFTGLSIGVVEVPIGGEHPPFAEQRMEKIYVGLRGDVQFTRQAEVVLLSPGDVLVFDGGEQYSYHNGGYEPARMLVLQRPGRERRAAMEGSSD